MYTIADWIRRLRLIEHPEGGYYRETWRAGLELPASAIPHAGPRSAGTAIHYLLPHGVRSRWHRVSSDELWIHQYGDPLSLWRSDHPDNDSTPLGLGPEANLQIVVSANTWQAAEVPEAAHGYALVCCVVVPGFDFHDFEMR